jgi:uncharacterized protein (DUF2249 family)
MSEVQPSWVAAVDAAPVVEHRLADIVSGGASPFVVMTDSAEALAAGEGLVLIAPLHPQPLCRTLTDRGFETWVEQQGEALWRVRIRRPPAVADAGLAAGPRFWFDAQGLHLDVRALPPPSPMIEALRVLDGLRGGEDSVLLHTPQFPVHLLPELEDRGWAWEDVTDTSEGTVLRLSRDAA